VKPEHPIRRQPSSPPEADLLGLPFDLHERYRFTAATVQRLWPGPHDPLVILDVGGHSSPLKNLLPGENVVLLDAKPPGSLTRLPLSFDHYVQASGAHLPFADDAFDVVTAHDTLEHIPREDREPFLSELLRVSRGVLVMNGPVYDPETVRAERVVARLQESLSLGTNQFLNEHLDLGLPERQWIEGVLEDRGLRWLSIPNGNLGIWLAANAARDLALALYPAGQLTEVVDRALNGAPVIAGLSGACYREAYVVAVDPSRAQDVDRLRSELLTAERSSAEAFREPLALLEEFIREARLQTGQTRERRLEQRIAELEAAHARITAGSGYRVLHRLDRGIGGVAPWGTRRRSFLLAPARAARMIMNEGWGAFLGHLPKVWRWGPRLFERALPPVELLSPQERYELWLRLRILTPRRLREMRRRGRRFSYRPKISVVMPVFDPEPEWLRLAVESVRGQVYPDWELCIADDGSTREGVRELLRSYARTDPRIVVTFLERNQGISAASNAALHQATGEFVGFLDHDDELKPNALFEVARLLNERRDLDYIYSDEDKKELDGRLTDAFFKPDWSPDLLMSVNYVTHFSIYRTEVLRRVAGFRSEYDGSQDYDLALRVTESTDNIAHIPVPLYSWRKVPGSAAASLDFKDYAYDAGKRALKDALARRGFRGGVEHGLVEGRYRVIYGIRGTPRVTVVIPTRDRLDLLEPCIESIRRESSYPNYEILVVDNDSRDPDTLAYLESVPGRVMRHPLPFNYARMMNAAVQEVGDSDFVLLLNNDTQVITAEWIEAMVEHAQRPEVAAVGARLLHPTGAPQHEGIVVGLRGAAAVNVPHAYFGLGRTIRNCSAVTAACMMVRPEVFRELGGFEERLAVAFNDVDFCLRAQEKGYQIVFTPYALLYHDEGSTRGLGGTQSEADEAFFRDRWEGYRDPYYNPSLDIVRPFELTLER
jgi:GT2 family glycosyltransferase